LGALATFADSSGVGAGLLLYLLRLAELPEAVAAFFIIC
jgi:hypothetical protein